MKASAGRQIFFSYVAEGLLITVGDNYPRRLAIRADLSNVHGDVQALAFAMCNQLEPSANIVRVSISQFSSPQEIRLSETAYVVDGEGLRLSASLEIANKTLDDRALLVFYNIVLDTAAVPHIEYNPDTLTDVLFPAIQKLFKECKKSIDAVAILRFQIKGFRAFEEEYELFEKPLAKNVFDPDWTERFALRMANVWRFADKPITAIHIITWLRQFDAAGFSIEARQLLIYLSQYGFVTEERIAAGLIERYKKLSEELGSKPIAIYFQSVGKSESRLAYKLRPEITLIPPDQAFTAASAGAVTNYVCFDDCIGSGETVEKYLYDTSVNPVAREFSALFSRRRAKLSVVAYHSDPRGQKRIEGNAAAFGAVRVHTICPIDDTHRVFSDESRIIPDPARRRAFEHFCTALGKRLFPDSPLGWGNCQWCVAYDYSIPDNSLPILFQTIPNFWIALFPRNR